MEVLIVSALRRIVTRSIGPFVRVYFRLIGKSALALTVCLTAFYQNASPTSKPEGQQARLFKNVHALCVGINRYQDSKINSLACAESDADAMHQLFQNEFGYSSRVIKRKQATKAGIEAEIARINEVAGENDAVILYFAGHGASVVVGKQNDKNGAIRRGFFLPFDSQGSEKPGPSDTLDVYEKTAINVRQFTDDVAQKLILRNARHVVLIFDSCFSGLAYGARGSLSGTGAERIWSFPSRQVLTAGGAEQLANENEDTGHGLFTGHLLETLRVKEIQSLGEVFVQARSRVVSVQDFDNNPKAQDPQHRDLISSDGDFVFVPLSIPNVDEGIQQKEKGVWKVAASRGGGSDNQVSSEEVDKLRKQSETQQSGSEVQTKEARAQVKRYRNAAAYGDPKAMEALALCYKIGYGVKRDQNSVIHWALEGRDSGDAKIKIRLTDVLAAPDVKNELEKMFSINSGATATTNGTGAGVIKESGKFIASIFGGDSINSDKPFEEFRARKRDLEKLINNNDYNEARNQVNSWLVALEAKLASTESRPAEVDRIAKDVREAIQQLRDKGISRTNKARSLEYLAKLDGIINDLEKTTTK